MTEGKPASRVGLGTVPWPSGRTPSRSYGERRVCASEDCGVVLSRYNPGAFCSGCNNPRDVRYPGQHRADER